MDPANAQWQSGAENRPRCRHSGRAPGLVALGQINSGGARRVRPRPVTIGDADFCVSETEAILFALAQAVEQRDRHTAGHCERLAFLSLALGMAMQLGKSDLLALFRGGYLHDVGKVGIPDSILFKPAALSADEWVVMRSHPARGEEICRPLKSLGPALPIIRHHHERWDGSGYPDGLRGEQIPLLARVLQMADIYDALISPRPYKPALSPRQALEIMQAETNRGWRDPDLMDLFLKLHDSVVSKVAEYRSDAEEWGRQAWQSLCNLQRILDEDAVWEPVPIAASVSPADARPLS